MSILLAMMLQGIAPPPPAPPPPPPPAPHLKTATPLSNPAMWVTNDDYPADAMRANQDGHSFVRVVVGTDGRVSSCVATGPVESLNQAACQAITQRARFAPLKDRKGRLVEGTWSRTVRWIMPEDDPFKEIRSVNGEMEREITFIVEKDGRTNECRGVLGYAGRQTEMPEMCATVPLKVLPFIDASGKPVRKKIVTTITIGAYTLPD